MHIQFFCTRWGSEHLDWNTFLEKARKSGYDGVEYGIANETTAGELTDIWEHLDKYGMPVIAQHYGTYDADFQRHYDTYAAWLEKLSAFPVVLINSQTGKDFFTFEQNQSLIQLAEQFSKRTGKRILHETHRNKFSFAAHVTRTYLERIPSLELVLDLSHWVCVAESYLDDQPEAVELALSRTGHIHARIGFPEGPQIPDPRASEWQEALNVHLAWWDRVVESKRQENALLSISPEFGPAPYMTVLPFTRQPIADQWKVNEHMLQLLKDRYHVSL